ncbi:MAG: hypothetical protein B0D96_00250 [Candidatus Sedimenticola endophacoides]|uniref:Cytochrome C n=1 Tax=Candidatus Sedimenticola endophacoides TaxID=2548426 RepID=A0A6N4E4C2_9GAMM|nr:MAG: hypothetical protein B0D94_01230 [Candidatus Sedimenticola endophacoides]OQX38401.1 MAG: hypothetical protein B0D96_00250 [Candidatus Sedimenticola endophacoides]OQX40830.1 MAG: hypothetical protein B0D89_06315 [Candidatus Sedimenticola endophacoides]OQX49440.1 MAG: hypothetical protein B0D87_00345 [Candidatus Sedimenticola endophacoides]PUE00386.1 MAG: cytochrome C [Candidatus Sedimenticola endophacoides]
MLHSSIRCGLALTLLLASVHSQALSPEALEGKAFYPACHVCHNPQMDPPLGPPMWGVQRRYRNATLDEEDFIERMAGFVRAPSLEQAIHDEALRQLGLMPPMPLPDEMLRKIARYILEETFAPPCAHWEIAVKRALAQGDPAHAEKDRNMLNRFCR